MKPDEVAAIAAIAQAVFAFAAIAIAVVVYRASNLIARMQYEWSVREAWNALDSVALSDERMLVMADRLMDPSSTNRSLEAIQRKWFVFMVLNALASSYMGAKRGLTQSKKDTLSICTHHLSRLVVDDEIFALTQHGYEKDFSAFCRNIREQQLAQRASEKSDGPTLSRQTPEPSAASEPGITPRRLKRPASKRNKQHRAQ
jgi:hypothetical protein